MSADDVDDVAVRPIRDEIRGLVEDLLAELV